jgi:SET domain-containing protein
MVTKRKIGAVAKSKRNTYVREVPKKGRGVFALRSLEEDDVIEVCPVLVFSKDEYRYLKKTAVHDYYFDWKKGSVALVLGFGSLYNHEDEPSAVMEHNMIKNVTRIIALRHIEPHEEITIDYTGGDPERELWFKVKK